MDSTAARAAAALLITMILWGSAAVAMRTQALALSSENSLALRYIGLTVINVAAVLWMGTWRVKRSDWLRFLVAGLAGMAGYNWFVNAGFQLVPAGVGTVITMVEPLMIAILAAVLLGEKLNRFVFVGVALALLGAVVLFWQDIMTAGPARVPSLGILDLILCCICWAIYTIACKPLLERYDSLTVTALTMIIAAPVMIGLASEPIPVIAQRLDLRQWAEVTYLVVASGLGGTIMWNYGMKHLSSTIAGTFLYLIPVVAVIAGALLLDEPVTVYIVAGGLLILAGVAAAQFGPTLVARR